MNRLQTGADANNDADADLAATAPDHVPQILVVDDAKENVRMLSALVKDFGRVSFALDGENALLQAARILPDLILLDIEMPGMDGMEVLRRLRADEALKAVPVIFVTGRADSGDEEAGLTLGAIDYITKPFKPAIVQARVQNQLLLRHYSRSLEQANQQLELLANTDPLTGARNRRFFMSQMKAEFERMQRYQRDCSVLMLDIDHFKRVNDTFGHDIGDEALIAFHRALHGVLRKQDTLARMGGEEFAVLLPETALDHAMVVADHCLQAVREIELSTPDGPLHMTTSAGAAPMDTAAPGYETALKHADMALYAAKQGGRDRAVPFSPVLEQAVRAKSG